MIEVILVVSLESRKLCLWDFSQYTHCYPVAIGKSSTPTPKGTFSINGIVIEPELIHYRTQENLGTGILGSLAISLGNNPNLPGSILAIHGTNQPELIGQAVSHGCIRMHDRDIQYIYQNYLFNTVIIQ